MKKIIIFISSIVFFSAFSQKKMFFDDIGHFNNGYAIVQNGNKLSFIDSIGNRIKAQNINLKKDKNYKLTKMNKNGFFIDYGINGKDAIRNVNGVVVFQSNSKIESYKDYYLVKDLKNKKCKILDDECHLIFEATFASYKTEYPILPIANYIVAKLDEDNNLYKIINLKNKTESKYLYKNVGLLNDGLIKVNKYVESDGKFKWGFLDEKNNTVIDFVYTKEPSDFQNGLSVVKNTSGKYGYIDKNNNLVINTKYLKAFKFINNKALVRIHNYKRVGNNYNNGYRIINKKGEEIYNLEEYKPLNTSLSCNNSKIEYNNILRLTSTKHKGLLNLKEKKVYKLNKYSSIGKFNSGLALANFLDENKKYHWGYINGVGELVFIKAKKTEF